MKTEMKKMKNLRKTIWIMFIILSIYLCVTFLSYAQPRIGLALGEGGSKFYAHIGVLKVLEEEGIKIDYLAGTSSGAFIAGLYALWEDIERIEKFTLSTDFKKYFKFLKESAGFQNINDTPFILLYTDINSDSINPKWLKGLIDGKVIRDEIDRLTNRASFEYDLKIPFKVVATDLITGEKVVIDHGRISNAIAASMAKPGTCIPFKFEDRQLVDGGLVDPVPADIVREMGADIVIGINLSDIQSDRPLIVNNVISIIYRSIYIMLEALSEASSGKADLMIKPEYSGPSEFDIDREERLKLIKIGEDETRKMIPLLKSLIKSY
ncbi:MAG: patatin-like phospholipase family protein [Candidatus Caldatribacteriota bacterium]|nr:patatin-like phospholipase family protein [Candidatus Caldatribacteriota bacterium]